MTNLIDRMATLLDGRLSRRGFLARTALAGTAMAVAPGDYLLKPVGAYQAICTCAGTGCDCGAACCDGYTEFCCTTTGMNRCPPGTSLGGWWKVDGSSFCSNGPRYYLDCNAACNGCGCGASGICAGSCSGTQCGCARGDCGYRRTGCVGFRYGQCNQGTACLGPIVCRVVTCVPPWTIDASCTRTVAVDEFTRNHTAPCLHTPFGSVNFVVPAPGGFRIAGWAVDPDVSEPITVHIYVDGKVALWHRAELPRPDVAQAFPGAGERHGFDVNVAASSGNHTVAVYAINVGTGEQHPLIGNAPVGLAAPFGWLDALYLGPQSVRIVGWVIDPDAPGGRTSLHVYVDGVFAGQFATDATRSDVGAVYQGFGDQHGYDVTLPVASGDHRIQVWALNGGSGGEPLLLADRNVTVGGSAVGAFESAVRNPGGIRVKGWALDPDSAEPLDIHLYVDGAFVGATTADRRRPDIGAQYPQYGSDHGFEADLPAALGIRQVTLYAIGVGGGARYTSLGTATVTVGDLPFGVLDAAVDDPAGVRVAGWCIDPDSTDPVDVHVYVDNVFAGSGRADVSRGDVGAGYPGYGATHGFEFTVPATAGRRTVCAYAINVGSGSSNPALGCRVADLT